MNDETINGWQREPVDGQRFRWVAPGTTDATGSAVRDVIDVERSGERFYARVLQEDAAGVVVNKRILGRPYESKQRAVDVATCQIERRPAPTSRHPQTQLAEHATDV